MVSNKREGLCGLALLRVTMSKRFTHWGSAAPFSVTLRDSSLDFREDFANLRITKEKVLFSLAMLRLLSGSSLLQ